MSDTILEELHQWKLKNPGMPRRVTLSSEGHSRLAHEFDDDVKGEVKTIFSIPFTVDPEQQEMIKLHT